MSATIVITTRNRREEVRRAVSSCLAQDYRPLEVLVYDDASADETSQVIACEFPSVRVERVEYRVGYIVLRNRAFREARGDILFSLDDDAYFTCVRTVSHTMAMFQQSPAIAAVALPYVEPKTTEPHRQMRKKPASGLLCGFVGCAHALRRSAVHQLGGYRDFFVHQGEERDLAIRLLQAGYDIVYGQTEPIVHDRSEMRDPRRMSYYGFRNTLLFDVLNVPHPYFLPRLAADAVRLFLYKLGAGDISRRLLYAVSALLACVGYMADRKPVSRDTYRRYRALPGHGPLPS